ncbi:alpha-(1,3)-fucosyltransferase C-like [Macrobrachium rosenbergii]|uniref:alpha-(1,3)-fucosyltransferase C-like n=1 Tax=Macrobrachium rosenbergii TaxID=79674 RepID=UPI0034D5D17C
MGEVFFCVPFIDGSDLFDCISNSSIEEDARERGEMRPRARLRRYARRSNISSGLCAQIVLMRRPGAFAFLFFLCCLLAYIPIEIMWPTFRTPVEKYNAEKRLQNFDFYEELPSDVTEYKRRPYFENFLRKLKRMVERLAFSSTSAYDNKDVKIILFWTSWFQKPWWVRYGGGLDLVGARCPETRCFFTHDKSKLKDAAAVLFQSQRVFHEKLPRTRSHHQRWVWVHVEPPTTSQKALATLSPFGEGNLDPSTLFNWTMTYHPDSEIMEPYGALIPFFQAEATEETMTAKPTRSEGTHKDDLSSFSFFNLSSSLRPALVDTSTDTYRKYELLLQRAPSVTELMDSPWTPNLHFDKGNHYTWAFLALNRTRLAVWVSSHCPTQSKREDYVRELQKFAQVDTYGTCGKLSCGFKEEQRDERCWRSLFSRKYLFYLAFENSMCDSYVTEKLWRPLAFGLVPIVMGGANYSKFLPPKSFINALEYSPQELVQLLRDLQDSPDYYIQYHIWRVFWRVTSRPPLCELCLKVHRDKSESVQENIPGWWRRAGKCRNPARWPKSPPATTTSVKGLPELVDLFEKANVNEEIYKFDDTDIS